MRRVIKYLLTLMCIIHWWLHDSRRYSKQKRSARSDCCKLQTLKHADVCICTSCKRTKVQSRIQIWYVRFISSVMTVLKPYHHLSQTRAFIVCFWNIIWIFITVIHLNIFIFLFNLEYLAVSLPHWYLPVSLVQCFFTLLLIGWFHFWCLTPLIGYFQNFSSVYHTKFSFF